MARQRSIQVLPKSGTVCMSTQNNAVSDTITFTQ